MEVSISEEDKNMGRPIADISHNRFGRLTARWPINTYKERTRWLCSCDCGKLHIAAITDLTTGHTKSCGCSRYEFNTKHGLSKTPEHNAWSHILDRCFNPNNSSYIDYGGRGITVCSEWQGFHGFEQFLTDVGKRPSEFYSLDRINNNGNYEPSNVRWATKQEQMNNRRVKRIENFTDAELLTEIRRRKLK